MSFIDFFIANCDKWNWLELSTIYNEKMRLKNIILYQNQLTYWDKKVPKYHEFDF